MAAGPVISLLWKQPQDRHALRSTQKQHPEDLNLDALVDVLSLDNRYRRSTEAVLQHPSQDPATLNFRLDVVQDFLDSPALTAAMEETLTIISALEGYMTQPQWEQSELRKVAWRLSELEYYVLCVDHLHQSLNSVDLRSEALCYLREVINATSQAELFQTLKAELPALIQQVREVRSITVGINLDNELRPSEAILLSINNQRFSEDWVPFFKRLLSHESQGTLGPLHKANNHTGIGPVRLRTAETPTLEPLFKDLADVMNQTCQPVAHALRRYVNISGRQLIALQDEIAFILGAIRLINHLRACGLPVCRPRILPAEDRQCHIDGIYNLNLALRMAPLYGPKDLSGEIITNVLNFGNEGRIFILTGPNRGGKTTYTQALGLAHVMMQAGLFVPAREASMSPVDGIFTHFAVEERPDQEAGRLGEEAQRLSRIFEHATRHSLLLFNESLASTSADESYFLARDIVRVVRLLGARAIFSTHLHELAADVDSINAETEGDSKVISLVSMVNIEYDESGEVARRTYEIVPSPPMGRSYAREIAMRYGISFDQLKDSLTARNQLQGENGSNGPA